MTTKPKVVAFHIDKESPEHTGVTLEPLIRLAEYEALQAENEKLRKVIRSLCNTYIVDDYYSGDLREEMLGRAIDDAIQGDQP